jgi:hypothetical protein
MQSICFAQAQFSCLRCARTTAQSVRPKFSHFTWQLSCVRTTTRACTPSTSGRDQDENGPKDDADLAASLCAAIAAAQTGRGGTESEREVLDGLAEAGASELRALGDGIGGALDKLSGGVDGDKWAEELVADQMEEVMEHFDGVQAELMDVVREQRGVIQIEADRIRELADSLKNPPRRTSAEIKQNVLFAFSGVFGVAALVYTFQGFADSSTEALQSAAVDVIAASFAAYLFVREKQDAVEANSGVGLTERNDSDSSPTQK